MLSEYQRCYEMRMKTSTHYKNSKKVEWFYASAVAVYTDSVSPFSNDHR